jgi:hypothetical protein
MHAVGASDLALIPKLTQLRQFDTCRLIPSRFADVEDSVLGRLESGGAKIKDLFEIDNFTNSRLLAGVGLNDRIGVDELVYGIPNFRIINAAFTYPRPEGSRFNDGKRGAWYCAFELETAMAEIVFHRNVMYEEIGVFEDCVSYQLFLADFLGRFHDLRGTRGFTKALAPNSYVASQNLADELLEAGSLGIIYPSVRRDTGTNLACFRPAIVSNVRKDARYQLTWTGTASPTIKTQR